MLFVCCSCGGKYVGSRIRVSALGFWLWGLQFQVSWNWSCNSLLLPKHLADHPPITKWGIKRWCSSQCHRREGATQCKISLALFIVHWLFFRSWHFSSYSSIAPFPFPSASWFLRSSSPRKPRPRVPLGDWIWELIADFGSWFWFRFMLCVWAYTQVHCSLILNVFRQSLGFTDSLNHILRGSCNRWQGRCVNRETQEMRWRERNSRSITNEQYMRSKTCENEKAI